MFAGLSNQSPLLTMIWLNFFSFQGVLRDERDLELFDEQFKDAYRTRRLDYFDQDDDESY